MGKDQSDPLFLCKRCGESKSAEWFAPSNIQRRDFVCSECIALKNKLANYDITLDQLLQMHEDQDGVCAICKRAETLLAKNGRVCSLSVDHDHVTGKVRGLLCHRCNKALGFMRDSPELLEAAAQYLRRMED